MANVVHMLQTSLFLALKKAAETKNFSRAEIEIAPCARVSLGHYQTNIALKLAKAWKMSPMAIAEKITKNIELGADYTVTITKPGFINISCSNQLLSKLVAKLLVDPKLGVSPRKKERVIVEFSSPNIAKELHVGHLRSTIIGESIARLLEFQEQDVIRLNHVGDWGTQFGMLIAYLREFVPAVEKESPSLEELMYWYKEAKKRFDEDKAFQKKAKQAVVALQSGHPESIEIWQNICEISRRAFKEIYSLLDVHLEERGESFYNKDLQPMVEELKKRGVAVCSKGAVCIFLEGFLNREGEPLPFMIQKSDGGFNYDTTDLAALKHRVVEEKADWIIIITDAGQSLHFQLLFEAGKKAGYYDPSSVRMDHVGFGLVLAEDGKKFKTRSGETKKLADLLRKAVLFAENLVEEKSSALSREEKTLLAKVLGISAVKYADLSSQRQKDYTFSYKRMLRFEGNTAAFLLYSYVRMLGIKRKLGASLGPLKTAATISLEHPAELALGLHLIRFSEVIFLTTDTLEPHHLCEYLYRLAEKFNVFFRDCRVEGTKEQESRLLLVEASRRVLEKGLYLLGIPTVERM